MRKLVFLLIIALAFIACTEPEPQPNLPDLTGEVSIIGTAEVGQTLMANTGSLGGSGTISYQWKRGTVNIGTNSSTYTVQAADIGSTITVTVTRSGNTGSVTSNPTGTVTAEALPTQGLFFTLKSNGTYSVSRGSATANEVVIPAFYNGTPVTEIPEQGFFGYTNMTSIVIPSSVTSIGQSAFYGCSGLISITIPFVGGTGLIGYSSRFGYIFSASSESNDGNQNSYIPSSLKTVVITGGTSIGYRAFEGCSGLTSITIPSSVTSIDYNAFYGCSGLTSINVDNNNPSYASQDGILYNKEKTQIIMAPQGITGSITIPSSLTSIGGSAFANCTGLTSITIPASVTSIGQSAFYGCSGLISVTFQGTITADNFGDEWFGYPFEGDLRTKYLAGGIGTYTRPSGTSETWTKQ